MRVGPLAGPAFALLLLGAVLLYSHGPAPEPGGGYLQAQPLATGPAALALGNELADVSPELVVSPLAEELRR